MRMSREFNLVLLGAGLLTAGYFLWPSDDARANDAVADAGGDNNGGGGSRRGRTTAFFIISSRSYTSTRGATTTAVSRGGFGGVGSRFSFGG
jgi:hypothetical protein